MRCVTLAVLAAGLVATAPSQAGEAVQRAEVAVSLPQAVGNVTFTPDGRMIFSHHSVFEPAVRVAELDASGKGVRPFPDARWNTPRPGVDDYLDSVLGIRADAAGVVWMLDMGLRTGVTPKLVGWNTCENRLERVHRIPAPASLTTSHHNDFIIDSKHGVFIIADEDIGRGGDGDRAALVVVDMTTGVARRLLEGHVSTRPERVPVVAEGRTLTAPGPDGASRMLTVGADGLAADQAFEWLYYGPLNGRWIYRVRIADLLDASLAAEALAGRVERYAEKPNNGGLSIDRDGNLYLTEVGAEAVGVIPADTRRYRRLAEHPDLVWPDGVSFAPDGFMYVSAAQVNRAAPFNAGEGRNRPPYFIFRSGRSRRAESVTEEPHAKDPFPNRSRRRPADGPRRAAGARPGACRPAGPDLRLRKHAGRAGRPGHRSALGHGERGDAGEVRLRRGSPRAGARAPERAADVRPERAAARGGRRSRLRARTRPGDRHPSQRSAWRDHSAWPAELHKPSWNLAPRRRLCRQAYVQADLLMSVQITPTHEAVERLTGRIEADDPFAAAIRGTRMAMVVSDARAPDLPIVFANDAFCTLSGYRREEVLGRNCRFMQGPDTDTEVVDKVRRAIQAGRHAAVEILNYRKDGEPFWNGLFVSPVRDASGEVAYFFGSQLDVTRKKEAELALLAAHGTLEHAVRARTEDLEQTLEQKTVLLHEVEHRVKNNLQLVSALIQFQARRTGDEAVRAALREVGQRVNAISTVHRRLFQTKDAARFDVALFLRDLTDDVLARARRDDLEVDWRLERVEADASKAAPLALLVHEVLTETIRRAPPPGGGGALRVALSHEGDRMELDLGGSTDASLRRLEEPSGLVEVLKRQLGAQIDWRDNQAGVSALISMPTG